MVELLAMGGRIDWDDEGREDSGGEARDDFLELMSSQFSGTRRFRDAGMIGVSGFTPKAFSRK